MASAKIACSLDRALLAKVEKLRKQTGESRSAFISRALARLTDEEAYKAKVREYVEAYERVPETEEDGRAASITARRALRDLPWYVD